MLVGLPDASKPFGRSRGLRLAMKENPDAAFGIPDIKGLRRFAESTTDREPPPFFVGRKEEIGSLQRDLQYRYHDWVLGKENPWEAQTRLYQGAPGAGKTALLRRLGSLTIQPTGDGDNGNGEPVGLNVCLIDEEAVFHNPTRLEKKIAEAFVPGAAREMEGRESVGESGEAGIDLKVARAGAQAHRSTDQPLRIWEEVAREVQEEPALHPPLLLMLDEAQALPEDECRQAVREFFRIYRVAGEGSVSGIGQAG